MMYGIIFWGNSPISREIFKIQKRAIRIITNKSQRDSCKHFFKQLQICENFFLRKKDKRKASYGASNIGYFVQHAVDF